MPDDRNIGRSKHVRAGDWRTLESFWNVTTTGFFRDPAGAEIRVLYSGWRFGVERQKQVLDGRTVKRLVASKWSVFNARMQMRVVRDTDVAYYVEPGELAKLSPEIHF